MAETERLAFAVFIDFDNIQIGVKSTLNRDFDIAVVLDALRERGEVVTKVAYGDWHRTSADYSRAMSDHAVQMVQRTVTPRGDKNGADITLSLDALEMAFTRHHINAFAIVGGDSDFIALVEKLKQYGKRVFVVGGRAFTSAILQRNCHEFIAYEHLAQQQEQARAQRTRRARPASDKQAADALPRIQRCLEILAEREIAPYLGPLKSTLLQLDPTFSERDYGASSFREFMQALARENLVAMTRDERGYLVAAIEDEVLPQPKAAEEESAPPETVAPTRPAGECLPLVAEALAKLAGESGFRSFYIRRVAGALRVLDPRFDPAQYGFRSITDLLMYAQREGLVRMQRDRGGAWLVWSAQQHAASAASQAVRSEGLNGQGDVYVNGPADGEEPPAPAVGCVLDTAPAENGEDPDDAIGNRREPEPESPPEDDAQPQEKTKATRRRASAKTATTKRTVKKTTTKTTAANKKTTTTARRSRSKRAADDSAP